MLRHRLVTGAMLVVAVVLLCWGDDWLECLEAPRWVTQATGSLHWPPGSLLVAAYVLLALPVACGELGALLRAQGVPAPPSLLFAGAALAAIVTWAPAGTSLATNPHWLATVVAAMLAGALLILSRGQTVEGVTAGVGGALLATAWLGVLPGFLLALRSDWSAWVVLAAILTTKSCDIGAYFAGRAIGRHKLIPWLSPGKTWEGLAGGAVVAALVGAALAALSALQPAAHGTVHPAWGAACGVAFALVGQFGDLAESLLKRGAGAKDSGRVLPGMGGILDVLDSPLAVGPVAWWMLALR